MWFISVAFIIISMDAIGAFRMGADFRVRSGSKNDRISDAALQSVISPGIRTVGVGVVYNSNNGDLNPPVITPTKHDVYTGRDPNRVKIFDTTLRDGEQAPGCTMNTEEKLAVAKQLSRLGVDIIEAGFPVSSSGDFEAVHKIASTIGRGDNPPIICGLARSVKKDISTCYDAIKVAKFPRIHLFIATSDIHMEHKLKKTREEVLAITTEMVSYAKSFCEDIEFSAEDALRSDPDFLCEVYTKAIEAGATTINVPDTVGYTTPAEFRSLIQVTALFSADIRLCLNAECCYSACVVMSRTSTVLRSPSTDIMILVWPSLTSYQPWRVAPDSLNAPSMVSVSELAMLLWRSW